MSLPLGATAAVPATYAAIQKKIYRSGMTTLIIPSEKMKGIIKIVKSLEESGLLLLKKSEMKQNNKTVDFLACY